MVTDLFTQRNEVVIKSVTLQAADIQAAKALGELGRLVDDRFRADTMHVTPDSKKPSWNESLGLFQTPSGKPLVEVFLPPSPTMRGMRIEKDDFVTRALVDLKTHLFYWVDDRDPTNDNGLSKIARAASSAGKTYGPMRLPAGARFSGKSYSPSQLAEIGAWASQGSSVRRRVTEKDNGRTVTIIEGQDLALQLHNLPNDAWSMPSTDESFGPGEYKFRNRAWDNQGHGERFQRRNPSRSASEFTWKTNGAAGRHTVTVDLLRIGKDSRWKDGKWETVRTERPYKPRKMGFIITVNVIARSAQAASNVPIAAGP